MVVPSPAGGGTDAVMRVIQPLLAYALGGKVVVDNRPGNNAASGSAYVSRAAADGYTLLFTYSTSHSISPFTSKNVSYGPVADFTPLGQIGFLPVLLVSSNDMPVKIAEELIRHAASGKLQYADGNGTGQVGGAALWTYAGIDAVGIPYRGTSAAVTDLMASRIN